MENFRYRAFISYRHVERDRKWARWLIEKLETFRTPRVLVRQGVPQRLGHLFRDDDEIPASSDLSQQIQDALRSSQYLIVVCSRDTPHSKWVRREIEFFRSIGRGDRIMALLVDGEPEESFPPELLRVPQERIAPDGAKIVELVDAEPIAADIRPRRDERRAVTERRAFLRIVSGLLSVSFDDLARRERQRTVRRQRIWGSLAAMLVLSVGVAGYAYWDYNRVKVRYYDDLGTRWGVPFGIGELTADAASRRNISYAIETRRGFVLDIKRVNGSGGPMPLVGDGLDAEAWDAGVSEWRIPYPSERAAEIDLLGPTGSRIRVDHYTWQPDGSAVVAFSNAKGGAQALTRGTLDSINTVEAGATSTKSQIAEHRLVFDPEGRVKERHFQTIWGAPARDEDGSFGRAYEYNNRDRITSVRDLDQAGRVLVAKTGVSQVRRFYSDAGDLASFEWHGRGGMPIANAYGFARVNFKYDDDGNEIQEDYFGVDGRPILRKDWGAARVTQKYDHRGNVIEFDYLDVTGHSIFSKDLGIARVGYKYDDNGNRIEEDYFGADGRPALRKDGGDARTAMTYDNRGNMVQQAYFGADGRPVLRKDGGIARAVTKYDDRGNDVQEDYFGLDGRPVLRNDWGVARVVMKYDDRGNMIETDFFGVSGRLALQKDVGVARITEQYDDRGNLIEMDCFDTEDRPVLNKKVGFARTTNTYDDRGNRIEIDYFGTDGRPILSEDSGFARMTDAYDDRGNEVEQDYFGTDGRPIMTKQLGVARIVYKRDDRGNEIEDDYFGVDGRPVLRKDGGMARLAMKYDDRGNMIEQRYFGTDGRPIVLKEFGMARAVTKYDNRGNDIQEDFFGADGQPVLQYYWGAASIAYKYDNRGNMIDMNFFDTKGQRILSKQWGAARVTSRYDDRDNIIEVDFFGTDNRPIVGKQGYAGSRSRYDALGNLVFSRFYDASGREIHPAIQSQ